jgi:aminoglycoside phosphotransferase (APT) family kinase protein
MVEGEPRGARVKETAAGAEQTARAVLEVLEDACPGLRVDAVRPGPSGYSSKLWLAQTDEGPLLVRIPVRDPDAQRVRSMIEATRLASAAGVPTVRFKAFAPQSRLGPVLVQEYRAGERASDFLKANPGALASVAEAAGRWAAILHGVQRPAFGDVLETVTFPEWPNCVTARAARALHAVPADALPQSRAVIEQAFERAMADLPTDTAASLVHADLYLDNILVEGGRPVCLLDFEHASYADRFAEFGKLGELLFDRWPGSAAPFMAAYREVFPKAGGDAARWRLGVGLYELSQLAYFHRWQTDLAPIYRDRLAKWLSNPPARPA